MQIFGGLFRRKSRLVVILLAASLALSVGLTPAYSLQSPTSATCKPDFTITVSPSALTIVKGGPPASIGVGFTSLCGLAGTINFGVRGLTSPRPLPATVRACVHPMGR